MSNRIVKSLILLITIAASCWLLTKYFLDWRHVIRLRWHLSQLEEVVQLVEDNQITQLNVNRYCDKLKTASGDGYRALSGGICMAISPEFVDDKPLPLDVSNNIRRLVYDLSIKQIDHTLRDEHGKVIEATIQMEPSSMYYQVVYTAHGLEPPVSAHRCSRTPYPLIENWVYYLCTSP